MSFATIARRLLPFAAIATLLALPMACVTTPAVDCDPGDPVADPPDALDALVIDVLDTAGMTINADSPADQISDAFNQALFDQLATRDDATVSTVLMLLGLTLTDAERGLLEEFITYATSRDDFFACVPEPTDASMADDALRAQQYNDSGCLPDGETVTAEQIGVVNLFVAAHNSRLGEIVCQVQLGQQ